ncbi:MAG: M14 family metallopeptidase [Bacteroidia bacterium]|nr:M14 family metallopeptidase [Bacteroidia bacterium]NNF30364.1 M14 family metallopeptidase [Flavobacteriaceae bacterium]NNK53491.1 M14 family metallopeptidase [Flavobacteriaceae bacterium]NNM08725.1 M14 family metallopeptidase [Flavobacteriaceae bacterium]
MRKLIPLLVLSVLCACSKSKEETSFDFTTKFEKSGGMETATYDEVVEFYTQLADAHTSVAIYDMDRTDSGKRLNLVTFNPNRSFESEFSGNDEKLIVLINNGIHPGESDGIDASMILMRDLAEGKIAPPKNTIVAVIPVLNIGGALNRNSTSRTNQNGPEEYGFRGNARNFDLNRDFIKADTKNTRAFIDLFRTVKPDLFIDTHVSNGADYQYTLTHLFTQHNKLGGALGEYMQESLMPKLEDSLENKEWDITPYVNVFNRTPESGFTQFIDGPRYSTGYSTLFNTIGMMVETHMLKPYKTRVDGTYTMLNEIITIADADAKNIIAMREEANSRFKTGDQYPLSWKVDSTRSRMLMFKGYEAELIQSEITGAGRLKYDSLKPYTKEIVYYDQFKPVTYTTIPRKYIIPKGYWNVMELIRLNKIEYTKAPKDSTITAQVYRITSTETSRRPYEGHYPHYNTEVEMTTEEVSLEAGDYIVDTNQPGMRYLLETLEPMAPDSFFNWNYFDTILGQKEGFSPYVWEDVALNFLNENPEIRKEFEDKKLQEPQFARNWYSQLDWIHKKSDFYEKAHLRYPIIRVNE